MSLGQQRAYVVFNKLFVNSVEDSSGIFIGTNQAIGWSAYSKTNQGFGSLTGSTLVNSMSIVQDPDMIDMPVEDVRNIALQEAGGSLQQCAIDFHSINANTVFNGSAIDLGENYQLGWRTSRKVNYGVGKYLGANRARQVATIIFDDDVVDAPMQHNGTVIGTVQNAEKNIRITQKRADLG